MSHCLQFWSHVCSLPPDCLDRFLSTHRAPPNGVMEKGKSVAAREPTLHAASVPRDHQRLRFRCAGGQTRCPSFNDEQRQARGPRPSLEAHSRRREASGHGSRRVGGNLLHDVIPWNTKGGGADQCRQAVVVAGDMLRQLGASFLVARRCRAERVADCGGCFAYLSTMTSGLLLAGGPPNPIATQAGDSLSPHRRCCPSDP